MTEPAHNEPAPNKVICPTCGETKLETPAGTTALPTLGMARKQAAKERGEEWGCDCGKYGPGEVPGRGTAAPEDG